MANTTSMMLRECPHGTTRNTTRSTDPHGTAHTTDPAAQTSPTQATSPARSNHRAPAADP